MTDHEQQKFLEILGFVHTSGRPAQVICASASAARALRRKFYYMRDQLGGEIQVIGESMVFRVTGRILNVTRKAEWVNCVSLGGSSGSSSSGESTPSNRLDDQV